MLHIAMALLLAVLARRPLTPHEQGGSVELVLALPEAERASSAGSTATDNSTPEHDVAMDALAALEQPQGRPVPDEAAVSEQADREVGPAEAVVSAPPPLASTASRVSPTRSVTPRPVRMPPAAMGAPGDAAFHDTSPADQDAGSPLASPNAVAAAARVVAGPDPTWLAGVGAWLLAHRSYPEMARALGREGVVVMQITVDRQGHVEAVSMVRRSGSDALDHAAETMLRNAQLPPFPQDMTMPRQIVTIPIRYHLD